MEKLRVGELKRDLAVIRDVVEYHAQEFSGQA